MNKIFNAQPGWYRGDFHAHTTISDGLHTPDAFLALAIEKGLDFVSITDHNEIGAWTQFSQPSDILVMPGIEVTLYEGHWNVFPTIESSQWMEDLRAAYDEEGTAEKNNPIVTQTMQAIADNGQINSINHPCLPPWAWQFSNIDLRHVHCLEIINDPTWPGSKNHPSNREATIETVAMWTKWLNTGYRITAIGGTDYHGPLTTPPGYNPLITHPATYVYAPELSVAGILQGLQERRVYISMGGTAVFKARINGHTYDIGQDMGEVSGQVSLTGSIANFANGRSLRIVKNGHVISELPLHASQATIDVSDQITDDTPTWYRLDMIGDNDEYLLITNPIFAGPTLTPTKTRYRDFILSSY
ncbi:MAG: CehA/McbA family metallohydrolase [Chloroflexi bacterium]|nr:CehA/McbA family metallohydrolase [Chloroflexota bacterium]